MLRLRGVVLHGFWLAVLLLVLTLGGLAYAGKVLNDALVSRPFSHHIWQDVLNRFVDAEGRVALTALRAEPKRLNQYLIQLEAVSPESHPGFFPTRADAAAYWINARNALALRIILDHYPAASREAIADFDTTRRYKLGHQPMSLSEIEARLAAVAMAPSPFYALSEYTQDTPPIASRVYQGRQLGEQLARARHRALTDAGLVRFEESAGCLDVLLSPFFARHASRLLKPAGLSIRLPLGDEPNDKPEPTASWIDMVWAEASGDVAGALSRPCRHRVRWVSPNPAWRRLAP